MQQTHTIPFNGGLDLITPPLRKKEGRVISSENYEPRPEGYKRIHGIERFDGQPQPHLASFWVMYFDAGTAAISEGDTVTGATSGATGKALIDAVITSGSYVGTDAVGYNVLSEVSGTFQDNENLQVSAATKSVANGVATQLGALNDTDAATWLQDSIETRRALIATVTGSGNMLGVWRYNSVNYAFRDNAGGTACDMWKSTASGWSQCDLGRSVAFTSGGTTEIAEEDVIEGATSGATATVKRVILTGGTWAGGDAVGTLILYSQSGTFQAENVGVAAANHATIASDSTASALVNGGSFEFINENFYGSTATERMYGCDGVSSAFEWDGSVFVPIVTGMTTDTPTHIAAHKKHLFLMFTGGSVQHSGIGTPYIWSVVTGASEIGIGDEGTGFMVAASNLVIYSKNRTNVLYGNSSADWSLDTLSDEAGAYSKTVQNIGGKMVHIDAAGVRDLSATQAYGDFALGNLSRYVDPWFKSQKVAGQSVTTTMRIKEKNQYRIFYDNDFGMIMDLTEPKPAFLVIDYGMTVHCACSVEDTDGTEWNLFGSSDGYVYRCEVGTSLDGSALTSFLRIPFGHGGSPRNDKRYHSAEVEIEAGPNTSLSVSADFGYGNPDLSSQVETDMTVKGGGNFWDEANWSEFYWGSQAEGEGKAFLSGIGKNISLVFSSTATYEEPHTLHGVTLNYSMRKLKR